MISRSKAVDIRVKGAPDLQDRPGRRGQGHLGTAGAYLPGGLPPGMEATEQFVRNEMAYSNGTAVADRRGRHRDRRRDHSATIVLVHDCGRIINPMIVDGQVMGGVVHGIGNAMFERMIFDDGGQPVTTTLAEYLLPASTEIAADRACFTSNRRRRSIPSASRA